MKIVYATSDGIAVITPAANCPLTLEQVAAKDVPTGSAYKIALCHLTVPSVTHGPLTQQS